MRLWLCMVAAAGLLAIGCGGPGGGGAPPAAPAGAKPVIYVSNYPLQYFTEKIGLPVIEVRNPVPPEVDPAYWEPTEDDIRAMQAADLIVLNGATYESWFERVTLPPSKVVDTCATFEDRLIELAGAVTHSHGPEGKHTHAGTAFTTWLDMGLAIEQARTIHAALAVRWPRHKELFDRQFAELEQRLRALDAAIVGAIGEKHEQPVIFSHPIYQYLQRRYDINGETLHWEPDAMPPEEEWRKLRALLARHRAKWMIWEAQPIEAIAERLKRMGLRVAVFRPCAQPPEKGDFATVMEENIAELRRVYGTETE